MDSILLFDDSLYVLKYLEFVVKKHTDNVRIFTSQTYVDAVEIIHTHFIDIAFIDLKMPGQNGADFIDYLNSNKTFSYIKKVVITETGKNSLLETSIEKHVDAYLHKHEVFNDDRMIIDCLALN